MNTLPSTAISMAKAGVPVFPVRPGRKEPMTRHGLHDATTDLEVVTAWWSSCPTANVAMPTGTGTVDALDIDFVSADESGFGAFRRIREAGLADGYHRVVRTPRRGLHLYYRPSGCRNGTIPRCHVDARGTGGYILVPPSIVNGRAYEVLEDRPAAVGVLQWNAIKELLIPTVRFRTVERGSPPVGNVTALAAWLSGAQEGERNRSLFWAANRAIESGANEAALQPLADVAAELGLAEREIEATIRSALRTSGRAA